MTTTITIYHNPRCTKSRQTLELLRTRGIEPAVVEYLKTPLDAATLKRLLIMLDLDPRTFIRKKEDVYRELNLDNSSLGDDALINAMVEHPILIERPIVVHGSRAAIGRPPEQVLAIL